MARALARQLSADCWQAIAVATLECRRQRGTIVRLARDDREALKAAGGLKAHLKAISSLIASKRPTLPSSNNLPNAQWGGYCQEGALKLRQRLEYERRVRYVVSTPQTRVPICLHLKRAGRARGKSTSLHRLAPG